MHPLFGPRAGGTLITISGANLDVGSEVDVKLAGMSCVVQRFVFFLLFTAVYFICLTLFLCLCECPTVVQSPR